MGDKDTRSSKGGSPIGSGSLRVEGQCRCRNRRKCVRGWLAREGVEGEVRCSGYLMERAVS